MNMRELKIALPILMKHRLVPFIWGQQGMGKTQGVAQIVKSMLKNMVVLHTATQEVGDLVGLLINNGDGTVSHARPKWMPTEGEGVIFLDEFNRMQNDEVKNVMLPFVNEFRIHTHELPKGYSIIAAGNYQSNAFNVTDISDSALHSRFCHIDFIPTVEEFISYAEDQEEYEIASFIRSNPELLEVPHKERLDMSTIKPDRRKYLQFIAPLRKESGLDSIRYEIYSGIIGPTATISIINHEKKASERLSGREVLNSYSKNRDKVVEASNPETVRFDFLNSAIEEILVYLPNNKLNKIQTDNLKKFLLDIPLELGLKFFSAVNELTWADKNVIVNDKEFVSIFKDQKLKA